jgi:hypothetical protein
MSDRNQIAKDVAHKGLDARAGPLNPEQRDVANHIVHANDYKDPFRKFGKVNPYWGPEDHTAKAVQDFNKVFPK